jgi:hypothetical protein
MPVGNVDTLMDATNNFDTILSGWNTWFNAWTLMTLACLVWAIQIASWLTPAAIVAANGTTSKVDSGFVSNPIMCGFNYFPTSLQDNFTSCFNTQTIPFDELNMGLWRTVVGTQMSGEIPTFKNPCHGSACNYNLTFNAPTLKCSTTALPSVDSSWGAGYLGTGSNTTGISWYGWSNLNPSGELSGLPKLNPSQEQIYNNTPVIINTIEFSTVALTTATPPSYAAYTCELWNTSLSYTVDFPQGSAGQSFTLNNRDFISSLTHAVNGGNGVDGSDAPIKAYWELLTTPLKGVIISDAGNDVSSSSSIQSAVRLTAMRSWVNLGSNDLPAWGFDSGAGSNIGDALELLSQNVSIAMIGL